MSFPLTLASDLIAIVAERFFQEQTPLLKVRFESIQTRRFRELVAEIFDLFFER
jgi:hypothetical protein